MKAEFFGTPHLGKMVEGKLQTSKKELEEKVEKYLDVLFKIDFEDLGTNSIDKTDLDRLLKLFEVLMYSKHKYPYIFLLDFDTKSILNHKHKLLSVGVYNDPHYKNNDKRPSVFEGRISLILSLPDVRDNPQSFTKLIKDRITGEVIQNGIKPTTSLCIGGTDKSSLSIGIPKKDFFKNKKPVFKIYRPIGR